MKIPFITITSPYHLRRLLLASAAALSLAAATAGWGQSCEDTCDATHLNTARGFAALPSDTGTDNTAIGAYTLFDNSSGIYNTAIGTDALISNTSGTGNNALGTFSMYNTTTGINNTGAGNAALSNNTTGNGNTGVGMDALDGATSNPVLTGSDNAALGEYAMGYTSGTVSFNAALGGESLEHATTGGDGNTAAGYQALQFNTSGYHNTATGSYALPSNTTGGYNAADGSGALIKNTTGSHNTACGNSALENNSTASQNIGLGDFAGSALTTGSFNIDIGNVGVAGEAGTIRIGTKGSQTATFVAGVRGVVVAGGQPVAVSATGQLGVKGSSARFKEAIQSMGDKSSAILSLRPVSFRYKKNLDPTAAPQFGLIAEEVARVDRDLVMNDADGKPLTVRYDEVNAMLLNEFLKEHHKVEAQASMIGELETALAKQEAQIKTLSSGLQKVNTRLEMARPTTRMVRND